MTDLVPAGQIEQIVGARRHALAHLGRAVSAERTVYILHSATCLASGVDLRDCVYSRALDKGIDGLPEWDGRHDRTVTLQAVHGDLIPGPDDIELVPAGEGAEVWVPWECPSCGKKAQANLTRLGPLGVVRCTCGTTSRAKAPDA